MALLRAALYIDGFNFYHSLDDLGQNHLKWLNMWALGELLIPGQSQKLTKVVCCTAVRGGDPAKAYRHRQYLKALKAAGVTCLEGHFAKE